MALRFNPFTSTFDIVSDDATTTSKGVVQLAGDLTGTAAVPILVNVVSGATVGDSTHIPVITYDNKGRITSTSTVVPAASTQRTFAYFAG